MSDLHPWMPLIGAGVAALGMFILWLLERRWRNASHVDAGWSAGIGVLAVLYGLVGTGDPLRRGVVAGLVALWALRLTIHLVRDRLGGRSEDGRYAMLRKQWDPNDGFWFFAFFQLQAGFVVIFSLPAWVVSGVAQPFGTITDIIGVVWFLFALSGVVLADRQLARWRNDPANQGRTCRAGLWRFSRHPNYFFEFLLWWSWAFLAVGGNWYWLTLFVPIFLLVLLLGVTGIPYNEKRAVASRGDDYRAYQTEVSAFIPWFPRRPSDTTHASSGSTP